MGGKTPPLECEFWWLEASSFLVVWGDKYQMSYFLAWTSRGYHGAGPGFKDALLPSVVPLVHWFNWMEYWLSASPTLYSAAPSDLKRTTSWVTHHADFLCLKT